MLDGQNGGRQLDNFIKIDASKAKRPSGRCAGRSLPLKSVGWKNQNSQTVGAVRLTRMTPAPNCLLACRHPHGLMGIDLGM